MNANDVVYWKAKSVQSPTSFFPTLSRVTNGRAIVQAARHCSLALLVVSNFAAVAFCGNFVSWNYTGFAGGSGNTTNFSDIEAVTDPDPRLAVAVNKTVMVSGGGVTGEAMFEAHAFVGLLLVRNQGSLISETPFTSGLFKTDVNASWSDTFRFNTTTKPPGTQIKLESRILLTGSLQTLSTGKESTTFPEQPPFRNADAIAFVRLEGTGLPTPPYQNTFFAYSSNCIGCTIGSSDLPAPQSLTVTQIVVVQNPSFFSASINLHGEAGLSHVDATGGLAGGTWIGDFSRTLRWGGITSVTDAVTGEPITDWTIVSESGFDYSRPYPEVPEPSSFYLLALGATAGLSCSVKRGCFRMNLLIQKY